MNIKKGTATAAVAEPEYLSAQWVYDTLMEEIEPDLMTANILKLDETYAGETEAEKMDRMDRYEVAFTILDECLEDLGYDMEINAIRIKKDMDTIASGESGEEDKQKTDQIEEDIDSSDFRA